MMIHIQPVVVQQFYVLFLLDLHFYLFLHFPYIIPSVLFFLTSNPIIAFVQILVLKYGNAEIRRTGYSIQDLAIKAAHVLGLEQNQTTIYLTKFNIFLLIK